MAKQGAWSGQMILWCLSSCVADTGMGSDPSSVFGLSHFHDFAHPSHASFSSLLLSSNRSTHRDRDKKKEKERAVEKVVAGFPLPSRFWLIFVDFCGFVFG
jgi:hypothetical protein